MKELKPHSYKLILRDISEGDQEGFEIFVPAFHAHCYGDTIDGALESYYIYFEDEEKRRKKKGIEMPKPDVKPQALRQVPLRLPQDIYDQAVSVAKRRGMSFNALVTDLLAVTQS